MRMNPDGSSDLQKYRQAGFCFLALNVVYCGLFFWFLPPFNLGGSAYATIGLIVALIGILAYFVSKGHRTLTLVLAVFYAMRAAVASYAIGAGTAFAAVPYLLPTLVVTFYFLGRAVWDWP
ncbi:MAG: hypothetical protein ACE5GQ_00840 [Nitrospinales bacterium]